MDMIKIAIADDNSELVKLMSDYLSNQPNMKVVAAAYNGRTCIEMLKKHTIDILVLDIIMPYLDGIAVLDAIKEDDELREIEVIMLSAFGQESIMSQAAQYGASYFIMKPFETERLAVQINHIMQNRTVAEDPKKTAALKHEKIVGLMKEIGIPPHVQGYHYLREAVSQVMDNPALLNKVTKELYPNVAERLGSTPSRVERSIRHAIELVWNGEDIQHIARIFGYSEEHLETKPTNSKFIAMFVNSAQWDDEKR